jgi:hypothetical protein
MHVGTLSGLDATLHRAPKAYYPDISERALAVVWNPTNSRQTTTLLAPLSVVPPPQTTSLLIPLLHLHPQSALLLTPLFVVNERQAYI